MSEILASVRQHLIGHFAGTGIESEPEVASVTFLGVERIDVLRFGPGPDGVCHYVSLGCSRYPMTDPAAAVSDPLRGPRAELVMDLRAGPTPSGLARSLAVLAATPAVEGVVLRAGSMVDLSGPLWAGAPFTAVVLGASDIPDLHLPSLDHFPESLRSCPPGDPVQFLSAVPVTQNEGAWIRLKGAEAMRQAWADDGVDVLDPLRPAAAPK
jgi:hypothetical protein